MLVAIRRLFAVCIGLGALIAFFTTVVVLGYAFKIIAFVLAVLLVLALILFLVWAAFKEFVIDAWKKPPK
ncbi:hypothetical protein HOT57_gp06 [Pseudomonas phage phCDa]|uniref:Uncharacterized protein n=1 Tax=Pseudomonas phage phCDa TaxID=2268587 RepID=A0A2Z5H8N8_9CAUD|nr:hypothetical protein HOT57_gp06 [Pseudomonas phage phCDa]AXC36450.1 hypothetical protein phCDa_6 [Pseudomonas phage phCDa]